MHVVTVTFLISAKRKHEFREAVLQQATNSLANEKGCHHFEVSQDSSSDNRFFLYELYDDKAAFELHLQSDHYQEFDGKTKDWVISKKAQGWTRLES